MYEFSMTVLIALISSTILNANPLPHLSLVPTSVLKVKNSEQWNSQQSKNSQCSKT